MGLFDNIKLEKMGRKGFDAHVAANDLYRRGKVADAKVKYDEAMKLYREAYDAGCRKNGILMSYGVLLMRYGEFERARELMKEISAIGGMKEDVHFELRVNYSICLWRLGELDKAIDTIRYAGKHSKNSAYYSSLGTFLVEKAAKSGEEADFEDARVLLDQAADYDEEDAATLDNQGEYHRQLGLWAAKRGESDTAARERKLSIEFYERARKARPSQITSLYALARFAKEDGDTAKARELVDRAILHSSSKVCPVSIEMLKELKNSL